ncbi:hypothetical protein PAXRUDRAFT_830304 [Paxillus rubicundulus Ve08.2h10]|uniref:Uncharacterized protein n=1 Tax=Paxillus rubicundulus Ve08.2h10 TaxID=930991 RepID=A0A0D0DLC7_9AGAM|nr:hypothetical protein PAXRUDRAFT_830304 [Paxillus rubicundulus Ve08.2h10]
MPISSVQKAAIEEVIDLLVSTTPARGKRQVSSMFLDLVDRADWPEYYEVIPEPRCINGVRASVAKNRYKDPLNAYTDLSLVFWNALFYNEPSSQIASDAEMLKNVLETEWQKRSVLPAPRHSPPPSSPQKVHGTLPAAPPQLKTTQSAGSPTKPGAADAKPAAATSSTSPQVPKPATRLSTPLQAPSPEIDIDINVMSPELDGHIEDVVMGSVAGEEGNGDSEAIIRQLEKSLPRWEGFGNLGWMSHVNKEQLLEIVLAIKSHKDIIGNRLAVALEAVPEEPTSPLLSFHSPLSLKLIEGRARSNSYKTSKDFDLDMARLFEKARRWYEPCTEPYGRVLLLQRLYQALTSPSAPSGPPYTSATNFASIRAGPGTARPLHSTDSEGVPGVTTFRVSTKDRKFVEEVHFKGWSIRLADWLHISNPDDPSRPIIGQVFKCWISDEPAKKGRPGLSICWYYRPEQTFHPAQTQFMDKEVFKTSLFADHPVEDVIEKIACQFTARHIRGRPRPPFWYPGWPLYVCHSRYNDRERLFVKIKNWSSCIPEEVRKNEEFMPIYPFERLVYPTKTGSPFVGKGAVKGPGGIGEPIERADGDKIEGGGTGRKRAKRNPGPDAGPSATLTKATMTGTAVASGSTPTYYQPALQQTEQTQKPYSGSGDTKDRSMLTAAGNLTVPPLVEKLPAETTKFFDRSPDTNEVLWFAAPPLNIARTPAPKHSLAYLHFLAKKRKGQEAPSEAIDVDDAETTTTTLNKKQRGSVPPTTTEMDLDSI